ncbi:MAG: ISAs1 family transposase [Phycisphaerae bacterium]|jgi:predicted transposase YbfD/YdcC|nr:ISAs1 family transposase [Phycisphaerae bacterium]MDP7288122.1 ISAs1 family transposase [Phycisphaerae bacterium]
MDVEAPSGLLRAFAGLKDPRMERTKQHSLADILAIAVCAVICGAEGWTQVELFGNSKLKWFKTFLDLSNGVPSHDTFGRVLAKLDPAAFEECFLKWVADLATASQGRLVAVDGKTIRRSLDTANDKAAIHMVSAWCRANNMVMGQVATDAKSNEITAIPKLLKLLDIDDAVVTIDAAGCQKKIARQIIDQGGQYVLQLKGNQGTLHAETVMLFDQCLTDDCRGVSYHTASTTNGGHGRVEQRRIWATSEVAWFSERSKWKNLRSLIRIERQRTVNGETSREYHYYISSLPADKPVKLLDYIRGHWGIENRLHWSLDVSFREDDCRIRQGHAAENFSRLSRIALNLLKAETGCKAGVKSKRLRCGWDHDYLLKVLTKGI